MSTLSYSAIISERTLNGREPSAAAGVQIKFRVKDLCFWYGPKHALWDVSLAIPERSVTALAELPQVWPDTREPGGSWDCSNPNFPLSSGC